MDMYTALVFDALLKKNIPVVVVSALKHMVGDDHADALPDHRLFQTGRWDIMLRCDSAYFPLEGCSQIRESYWAPGQLRIHVGSSFKNYDDEVAKFLDWIEPYTEAGEGYYRYEESEEPSFIRIGNGRTVYTESL